VFLEEKLVRACCSLSEPKQIKPFMSKGERISQFVPRWLPEDVDPGQRDLQGIHSIVRFSIVG